MKREIDTFVGDAPQFDDITMLVLYYHGGLGAGTADAPQSTVD